MTKCAGTSFSKKYELAPVFTNLVKFIMNEVLESKFMKTPIPNFRLLTNPN